MVNIPRSFPDLKRMAQSKNRCNLANYIRDNLLSDDIDPKTIVDLGCGPMTTTSALARLFPNARVFGCDVKAHNQGLRSALPSNLQFRLVEPFALADQGIKADFILLGGVVHHVEPGQENRFLSDVRDSLSDDGRMLVHEHSLSSNPTRQKIERILLKVAEFAINRGPENMECSYNFFTPEQVRRLLTESGFEVMREFDSDGRFVTLPSLNGNTVYWCKKGARPE